MKYVGIAVLTVLIYFVVGYTAAALGILALPLFKLQTQVNNAGKIINKTYDADNQIYNYHWFKETSASIDALSSQVENAKQSMSNFESGLPADRTQWGFEDKTEDNRLRQVILGLQNQKESLINEYNARAKEADRNIFQDGLKTFIPLQ